MARHGENIRKRKDGRWEGRYKAFDKKMEKYLYRSVYGRDYGEVKQKLSAAKLNIVCRGTGEKAAPRKEAEMERGIGDGGVVMFSQAAGEWFAEYSCKWKYSTYIKYDTVYRTHLAGIVGSYGVSADTLPEMREKISDHLSEDGISESLQKSVICVANQIFAFMNRRYSVGIPLITRPSARPNKKTAGTLSMEEQEKLLGYILGGRDKFMIAVLLCLYAGLRLGELCALRWADIDFEGMTLTVNRTVQRITMSGCRTKTTLLETDPKSGSSRRMIPLIAGILETLSLLEKDQPYVFGGEKPMEPRTMQYRFKKILKEAGIEDKNFHILRHTFATNCVENGMDVKVLSEILGHSDVKITLNRYVHPTMNSKRKQIGMLSNFYGQICGLGA